MDTKNRELLAPIILFVYNRPKHSLKTLEALAANALASESVLYIYADGPKKSASSTDLQNIILTREVIKKRQWCKEVFFVEGTENKGLANSIIEATTEIVNQYGKVITLEDDVIVSTFFLEYMNTALTRYASEPNVFMVAGYFFPVPSIKAQHHSFFLPLTSTQAWGTWQRAWQFFDPNATGYQDLKTDKKLKAAFNLDNSFDYTSMLIQQMEIGNISSWAIRWWWTVFCKKGLVLYPDKSLIKNIGWDNTGTHSGGENPFEDKKWYSDYKITKFPDKVEPCLNNFNRLKKYLLVQFQQERVTMTMRRKFWNKFLMIFSKR